MLKAYRNFLKLEERSDGTIDTYSRYVTQFLNFTGWSVDGKEQVIAFKEKMKSTHCARTVNVALAAVREFLDFIGAPHMKVNGVRVQRSTTRMQSKVLTRDEYKQLVLKAYGTGKMQTGLILETLASTGVRVSELQFVTVEGVKTGRVTIDNKGKIRQVSIPKALQKKLLQHCEDFEIVDGVVFRTRNGLPQERSNILHRMKKLAEKCGIPKEKVFPHNLRHLFAVEYYKQEGDIVRLADILGHSNVNTTRIYTMLSAEQEAESMDRMGMVI